MGWDDSKKAPDGHVVHYKQLWNIGFHIFVGVCYCMKDTNENHFQFMHHNVSGEMMEVSMLEFVKYWIIMLKNQVCFTHQNVLDSVTMFHKHKMKNTVNSSLVSVLHQMIQTSQFYHACTRRKTIFCKLSYATTNVACSYFLVACNMCSCINKLQKTIFLLVT